MGTVGKTPILLVRSAALSGFEEVARELRLDSTALLRRAGFTQRILSDPEMRISADAVRDLLEEAAQLSGAEDFGLRMAARRTFANLGPISLVISSEPTARQALDTLCRYLRLVNASLITHLDEHEGMLTIREELLGPRPWSQRQSMELAIAIMFRCLQELIGPSWRPVQVCFTHRSPKDLQAHRAYFGVRTLQFDHEFNGIVCRSADLDRPRQEAADSGMARLVRRYLDRALSRDRQSMRDTVRQLIVALLPGGLCSAPQVALHLGVDRRTIHRRLTAEGVTFSELLAQARRELVQRQLQDSDLPVAEIAGLLGFSSSSAMGHWFSREFGTTTSQWRKVHRARAVSSAATG